MFLPSSQCTQAKGERTRCTIGDLFEGIISQSIAIELPRLLLNCFRQVLPLSKDLSLFSWPAIDVSLSSSLLSTSFTKFPFLSCIASFTSCFPSSFFYASLVARNGYQQSIEPCFGINMLVFDDGFDRLNNGHSRLSDSLELLCLTLSQESFYSF